MPMRCVQKMGAGGERERVRSEKQQMQKSKEAEERVTEEKTVPARMSTLGAQRLQVIDGERSVP